MPVRIPDPADLPVVLATLQATPARLAQHEAEHCAQLEGELA